MRKIIFAAVLGFVFSLGAYSVAEADNHSCEPNGQCGIPGLGGYAVVHEDGHVCGVIVGNSYFAGNDKTMSSSFMGCEAGSRIIFQTNPSPTGNVAGYHGDNITYSNGVFSIINKEDGRVTHTIKDGIYTAADGRAWDSGSGAVIATAVPELAATPLPNLQIPAPTQLSPQLAATSVSQPTAEPTQWAPQPTATAVPQLTAGLSQSAPQPTATAAATNLLTAVTVAPAIISVPVSTVDLVDPSVILNTYENNLTYTDDGDINWSPKPPKFGEIVAI